MTKPTTSTGALSVGALVCLIAVGAALGLRRQDLIPDSIAVPLAAVAVLGVAVFTVWAGVRTLRRARE